jgi:4-aminobutyrate aminotransferase-like enzyme
MGDVRGLGLMVAVEFVKPGEGDGRVPDTALTKRVQADCFARNLLLLTAGTSVNVIRIIPPLVTTAEEVDRALGIIAEALDAAGA